MFITPHLYNIVQEISKHYFMRYRNKERNEDGVKEMSARAFVRVSAVFFIPRETRTALETLPLETFQTQGTSNDLDVLLMILPWVQMFYSRLGTGYHTF